MLGEQRVTRAYRALLPSELLGLMPLSDVLRSVSCSSLLNNESETAACGAVRCIGVEIVKVRKTRAEEEAAHGK